MNLPDPFDICAFYHEKPIECKTNVVDYLSAHEYPTTAEAESHLLELGLWLYEQDSLHNREIWKLWASYQGLVVDETQYNQIWYYKNF